MSNIQHSSRSDEWYRKKLRQTWFDMHRRCYSPTRKDYKYYGAKGIAVELDWHDFDVFYRDMRTSYSDGFTLDRKNRLLNYSASNCQWLTRSENSKKSHRDYKRMRPKGTHNTTNKKDYIFFVEGDLFIGKTFEFCEKYKLDCRNVSAVTQGKRLHHKKWRVLCPIPC